MVENPLSPSSHLFAPRRAISSRVASRFRSRHPHFLSSLTPTPSVHWLVRSSPSAALPFFSPTILTGAGTTPVSHTTQFYDATSLGPTGTPRHVPTSPLSHFRRFERVPVGIALFSTFDLARWPCCNPWLRLAPSLDALLLLSHSIRLSAP